MKKTILIIIIFTTTIGYSQVDFSKTKRVLVESVTSKSCLGNIEIVGDSLSVIKVLLDIIEEKYKENESYMIAVNSSVKWSNTVPDYWKKNKQWSVYIQSISKYGFKYQKIKK